MRAKNCSDRSSIVMRNKSVRIRIKPQRVRTSHDALPRRSSFVMAFADGEIDGEQIADVEALLARDAEARELVASIRALGEGVRMVGTTLRSAM